MIISHEMCDRVRQRAHFACEYCGIREGDIGGQLTVDHFQPLSKGGSNEFENLVYCCIGCNQRKLDFWPRQDDDPQLTI